MTDEILSPRVPRPPMSDWDRTRTTAAGKRVRIGASADRKMKSNKTMMNSNDSDWVSLPWAWDWLWLATPVATAPAKWTSSPGGSDAFSTTSCIRANSVLSSGRSLGEFFDSTRICAASRSGERLPNWTRSTVGTRRRLVPSDWTAEMSEAPSVPWRATATTWISDWLAGPVSGMARLAAWLLGAFVGRKALLLLFTWLPRLGRARVAIPVPTSHRMTTIQR